MLTFISGILPKEITPSSLAFTAHELTLQFSDPIYWQIQYQNDLALVEDQFTESTDAQVFIDLFEEYINYLGTNKSLLPSHFILGIHQIFYSYYNSLDEITKEKLSKIKNDVISFLKNNSDNAYEAWQTEIKIFLMNFNAKTDFKDFFDSAIIYQKIFSKDFFIRLLNNLCEYLKPYLSTKVNPFLYGFYNELQNYIEDTELLSEDLFGVNTSKDITSSKQKDINKEEISREQPSRWLHNLSGILRYSSLLHSAVTFLPFIFPVTVRALSVETNNEIFSADVKLLDSALNELNISGELLHCDSSYVSDDLCLNAERLFSSDMPSAKIVTNYYNRFINVLTQSSLGFESGLEFINSQMELRGQTLIFFDNGKILFRLELKKQQIKEFVDSSANGLTTTRYSLLHAFIRLSDFENAKKLLLLDANPNLFDINGYLPLFTLLEHNLHRSKNDLDDMAKSLLDAGSKLDCVDYGVGRSLTALAVAVSINSPLQEFLLPVSNLNLPLDSEGNSYLSLILPGRHEIFSKFLEHDADPNNLNAQGQNPLMLHIYFDENTKVVEILAPVTNLLQVTSEGYTVFEVADSLPENTPTESVKKHFVKSILYGELKKQIERAFHENDIVKTKALLTKYTLLSSSQFVPDSSLMHIEYVIYLSLAEHDNIHAISFYQKHRRTLSTTQRISILNKIFYAESWKTYNPDEITYQLVEKESLKLLNEEFDRELAMNLVQFHIEIRLDKDNARSIIQRFNITPLSNYEMLMFVELFLTNEPELINAIKILPNSEEFKHTHEYFRAINFYIQSQYPDAITSFKLIPPEHPFYLLAFNHITIHETISAGIKDENILISLGENAFFQGKFKEAFGYFQQARLTLISSDNNVQTAKCLCYAAQSFYHMIKQDPLLETHNNFPYNYAKKTVELLPDNTEYLKAFITIARDYGYYEEAVIAEVEYLANVYFGRDMLKLYYEDIKKIERTESDKEELMRKHQDYFVHSYMLAYIVNFAPRITILATSAIIIAFLRSYFLKTVKAPVSVHKTSLPKTAEFTIDDKFDFKITNIDTIQQGLLDLPGGSYGSSNISANTTYEFKNKTDGDRFHEVILEYLKSKTQPIVAILKAFLAYIPDSAFKDYIFKIEYKYSNNEFTITLKNLNQGQKAEAPYFGLLLQLYLQKMFNASRNRSSFCLSIPDGSSVNLNKNAKESFDKLNKFISAFKTFLDTISPYFILGNIHTTDNATYQISLTFNDSSDAFLDDLRKHLNIKTQGITLSITLDNYNEIFTSFLHALNKAIETDAKRNLLISQIKRIIGVFPAKYFTLDVTENNFHVNVPSTTPGHEDSDIDFAFATTELLSLLHNLGATSDIASSSEPFDKDQFNKAIDNTTENLKAQRSTLAKKREEEKRELERKIRAQKEEEKEREKSEKAFSDFEKRLWEKPTKKDDDEVTLTCENPFKKGYLAFMKDEYNNHFEGYYVYLPADNGEKPIELHHSFDDLDEKSRSALLHYGFFTGVEKKSHAPKNRKSHKKEPLQKKKSDIESSIKIIHLHIECILATTLEKNNIAQQFYLFAHVVRFFEFLCNILEERDCLRLRNDIYFIRNKMLYNQINLDEYFAKFHETLLKYKEYVYGLLKSQYVDLPLFFETLQIKSTSTFSLADSTEKLINVFTFLTEIKTNILNLKLNDDDKKQEMLYWQVIGAMMIFRQHLNFIFDYLDKNNIGADNFLSANSIKLLSEACFIRNKLTHEEAILSPRRIFGLAIKLVNSENFKLELETLVNSALDHHAKPHTLADYIKIKK